MPTSIVENSEGVVQVTVPVEGMTCASCVGRVERALAKLDGVEHVAVNLATERATLQLQPAETNAQDIASAIEDAGYRAGRVSFPPIESVAVPVLVAAGHSSALVPDGDVEASRGDLVFDIEGMTCASCAGRVERPMKKNGRSCHCLGQSSD